MKYLIPLLLIPTLLLGSELKMLDLRYEEATGTNRSFEYEGKKKGELGLHFNYQLISFIDLDTTVNSKIDEHQFRYVELNPYLNIHLNKDITLYAKHRSGHCLDCTYTNISKFPNENGVGIKLVLFQN
ncbi:hypothetical protein UFOVP53_137 [uncultured Caudovirales phage]|uniref:Uncharacterized protein n=1 Tax=uncultured Caudovirales phage TaxID=2100421 RepID=A0A6J5KSK6_9CAUD|nr:hypothetical protein UFOVP53_137 [uncultured Caudovirales phage]